MKSEGEPSSTYTGQAAPRGNGERILYVDDELPLLDVAMRTLAHLGYKVTGASAAKEALELFSKDPTAYDLVVTDYQMPGGSGLDLVADLVRLRPGLPVILATGLLRPREEGRVREVGVRELFLKPYTPRELGDVVHRVLRSSPKS